MKEFFTKNKGKIVGNFSAAIGGTILAGIIATALGEKLGYGTLAFYVYGLFGHRYVAGLIESKVK